MWLWHNGELRGSDEVCIPVSDHGFLYGMGLFETFRTFDGKPFLFDAHWERLTDSLDALWIDLPYRKRDIEQAIQDVVRQNDAPNLYIRLNVSAGVAPLGLHDGRYGRPNVTLLVKPLAEAFAPVEKRLEALPFPRSRPEAAFRLKSHHYMNNILGKRALIDREAEGLFADESGSVVEGLVSNVFWTERDGRLFTTPLSSGALAGVTRKWVMETFDVSERAVTFEELAEAEEIWLTNSIQQIAPVTDFSGRRFPGKEGARFTEVWQRVLKTIEKESAT
ncbi:MAG: aminotransferase class IV [Exiguobacterium sp.]|uniref:Aminotransferase class IV n=1 Tax=Exiguobacterium alkaliphilum TaxID=1428684 RepID=A0ABT2L2S9_9BACL|nr:MULTISPECIES: aminotransferase class IV [Exiguobacterium]MCT4796366.1 aminotransferase class IV [Exiguobacterium alkaliphilum]MDX5322116.1 aminotransferase class IV [Exiguobacterium sp.]MDX5423830.1 aminotransferase class IV [Exiguobacterium sp.]MDX6771366.1 aminotransferase class IV [Exiguobacterium sp.]